jgi:hypothetical protein
VGLREGFRLVTTGPTQAGLPAPNRMKPNAGAGRERPALRSTFLLRLQFVCFRFEYLLLLARNVSELLNVGMRQSRHARLRSGFLAAKCSRGIVVGEGLGVPGPTNDRA